MRHPFLALSATLLLAACGNGSSNSGGGTASSNSPVAVADTVSLAQSESKTVDVLSNDYDDDDDTLTITELDTEGFQGDTKIENNAVVIDAGSDFIGTTTLKYRISDGQTQSNWAEITVTIHAVNQKPDAVDDTTSVLIGQTVVIDVLSNDSDPESQKLTLHSISQTSLGTVALSGNTVTFAAGQQAGTVKLPYIVEDEMGAQATATLTIEIKTNTAPVARDDFVNLPIGGTLEFNPLANDEDPDGQVLALGMVQVLSGGSNYPPAKPGALCC